MEMGLNCLEREEEEGITINVSGKWPAHRTGLLHSHSLPLESFCSSRDDDGESRK